MNLEDIHINTNIDSTNFPGYLKVLVNWVFEPPGSIKIDYLLYSYKRNYSETIF